jgi:hypothetical protein
VNWSLVLTSSKSSKLSNDETVRLERVLKAAWAIPFLDDIGDFAWEAAFHYVKGLPIPDTIQTGQSKLLFDAVDRETGRGWSLKALQLKRKSVPPVGSKFEFIIQRASILKKTKGKKKSTKQLTLAVQAENTPVEIIEQEISLDSSEAEIGRTLINYWNNKVKNDMRVQSVKDGRLSILLKNANRQEYVLIEKPIPIFNEDDFEWSWTDEDRVGFQAKYKKTSEVVLKWYHGQTQLFQVMTIPEDATRIQITPRRLGAERFVTEILRLLPPQVVGKTPE